MTPDNYPPLVRRHKGSSLASDTSGRSPVMPYSSFFGKALISSRLVDETVAEDQLEADATNVS